jgi:hypothetical protein
MKSQQIGLITLPRNVNKGSRSASISLSPHEPKETDVQRLTFLSELAGLACACAQESDKEFSQLWGSDTVLTIEVRFLKGSPRPRLRQT